MPLSLINYNRDAAVAYARRWAFSRNPLFLSFNGIGGNCTNFVSQCVYAGCCAMNYTPDYGWYYISPSDRAAAWTSVAHFHRFFTTNEKEAGPFAEEAGPFDLVPGDVIQLGDSSCVYYHTLIVVGYSDSGEYLIASNSYDSLDRPLSSYGRVNRRYLHIHGARGQNGRSPDCFESVYNGTSLGGRR